MPVTQQQQQQRQQDVKKKQLHYSVQHNAEDYQRVAKDIEAMLDRPGYDDGSIGPVLIRLAWHASGTYCRHTKTGGSMGATMRFAPESTDGANAGLEHARLFLEPIKQKHPWISYGDLWTLAGVTALRALGGPAVPWQPGRIDLKEDVETAKVSHPDGRLPEDEVTAKVSRIPPNGRLPDASLGNAHVREVFYRMGFNDRDIVALLGAHALGRCHRDRSGYEGAWTYTPTRFSNQYYKLLLNTKWVEKKWDGPQQWVDEDDELMMLPAEIAMLSDPEFKKYIELYAKDKDTFYKDFAAAFGKLLELGVTRQGPNPKL